MAVYSCDTSSFLDAWIRHYPPDTFPGVWEQIGSLVAQGQILFIDEVVEAPVACAAPRFLTYAKPSASRASIP